MCSLRLVEDALSNSSVGGTTMARAKVLGGSGTRLDVWIDTDADRMLHEMLDAWYPGYTRVQGDVVTRAIKLLYRQFQREQRKQKRADA